MANNARFPVGVWVSERTILILCYYNAHFPVGVWVSETAILILCYCSLDGLGYTIYLLLTDSVQKHSMDLVIQCICY